MVPLTFALNKWNAAFQELQAKFQAKYTAASRKFISATPLHNLENTPLTLTQLFKSNKDVENCILARLDLVALGNLSLTCKTFFNKYAPRINEQISRDFLKNTRSRASYKGFVCGEFQDQWMEEISLRPQSTPVDCLNSYIRNVKAIRRETILEHLDPLTIIKNDYLCLLRPSAYKTHNFVTWEMMYRCIGLPFNFHRREEVDLNPSTGLKYHIKVKDTFLISDIHISKFLSSWVDTQLYLVLALFKKCNNVFDIAMLKLETGDRQGLLLYRSSVGGIPPRQEEYRQTTNLTDWKPTLDALLKGESVQIPLNNTPEGYDPHTTYQLWSYAPEQDRHRVTEAINAE